MKKRLKWAYYAGWYVLKQKIRPLKAVRYCRRPVLDNEKAALELAGMIAGKEPFAAGRMGLSEASVIRAGEFERKDKYATVINQLYEWSGFFPNEPELAVRFTELMREDYRQYDLIAANRQLMESYFINRYTPKHCLIAKNLGLYDVYNLEEHWTKALAGKKVLVVTSFPESVQKQYERREEIYPGSDILPEFASLSVYKPLMTIGDMKDERFSDWFEALEFMKNEILAMDFDIALLACGAYGFPLGAEIRRAGKQAVCMGGVLQILFGIMGRRWDGSRFGGPEHMPEKLKAYYSDAWIYPLEERPAAADGVEYGPYWK